MSSADGAVRAPERHPLRAAFVHLGLGALAFAGFAFGPVSVRGPAVGYVVIAATVSLHIGVRRFLRPDQRRPWHVMLVGGYIYLISTVARVVIPGATMTPDTLVQFIPSALLIPAYLCYGLALVEMLRRRRAAEDDPARIDALLVGLGAAFLTWTFVIVPVMENANLGVLRTVDAAFPLIDVVLLVLVTQLALAGSARRPALWMLILATSAMFVGDILYILRDASLALISQHTLDSIFVVMCVLYPTAALLPSMRSLTEPQQIVMEKLSHVRIGIITVMMIVPVVATSLMPLEWGFNSVVRTALCVLLMLAVLARVIRANNSQAHAERVTRRRATHDALTDLPNRELLAETVAGWGDAVIDDNQEISLLFLDLDRFKMVNDHWGHRVGDELLVAVAERLRTLVRAEDMVCRIGGDEFVIALSSPSHLRLAESLASRLLDEFTRPFRLSVGEVATSVSIGVAKSHGGAHAVELIRDADTAMYKAKGSGRNAYALFDNVLRDQVRDRVKLEQALRGASERGELAVHFQPIIDLDDGELDGFEALMRWNSPELGAVSPVEFIPIAEDTGMIVDMGAWLLRESVRQLAEWNARANRQGRPLHVSVNVAVRQLRDGSLITVVQDVLRETGVHPSWLWLEITESSVMEDLEATVHTLNALRALGVTLCIDDFGTGYSSLSYLHRLPVGIVKIDRSFVSSLGTPDGHEPIVRAVLAMTRAMGHRVVAEGVESATQRDWLRAQGCELAQGWLYGKAERPENLTEWVGSPARALN